MKQLYSNNLCETLQFKKKKKKTKEDFFMIKWVIIGPTEFAVTNFLHTSIWVIICKKLILL